MSTSTRRLVPRGGWILGLVWMMFPADPVLAQRSSSGSFGNATSSQQNSRFGTNRQNNRGLQSGNQSALGRNNNELGQTVAPGLTNDQPQGREFQEGAFVGRDAQDVRDTFRTLSRGQGRRAMMDMVIENLNDMRESRQRWRDQQSQPPAVRVQLRPAFEYPSISLDQIASDVQFRLTTILRSRTLYGRGMAPPRVLLEGRTVTLRGAVSSEHEKSLIGQLVTLEPGVSKVENRLVVTEP